MRRAVLLAVLVLAACGEDPTAPTSPPAPRFPPMTGGWNGTRALVWTTSGTRGTQTCSEVWLITGQENGNFSGSAQLTGEDCSSASLLRGTVTLEGAVTIAYGDSTTGGPSSPCHDIAGDPDFIGTVSASGGLTALRTNFVRCVGGVYGSGIVYQILSTLTMNRR